MVVVMPCDVTGTHGCFLAVPVPTSAGTGSRGYGFTRVWVRVDPNLPMGYP